MRILFVARSLECGGAERQLSQLARALKASGDEISVAVFYDGGMFQEDLRAGGIPIVHLKKRSFWDLLGPFLRLVSAARTQRSDVVYSFMLGPNILAAASRPFIGKTRVVWGIRSSETNWRVYGWSAVVAALLERWLSRFADLVICNSEVGRRESIENGFPEERTVTIANGIDTNQFRPDPAARRRMRKALGLRDEHFAIGIVGRLDPHKGHKLFFDAARRVAAELPLAAFVCVGGGPDDYVLELRRYAANVTNGSPVIWAGVQADMIGVYNALDVLALTSIGGDGFPNVLAEAMACGTPCIATVAGDSKKILSNSTWVVNSRDGASIAAAILTIADVPKASLGEGLRQRIVSNFSLVEAVRATRHALASL